MRLYRCFLITFVNHRASSRPNRVVICFVNNILIPLMNCRLHAVHRPVALFSLQSSRRSRSSQEKLVVQLPRSSEKCSR